MNYPQNQSLSADILIVDDTLDNLRLLSTMLIENGYKVRKATNGEWGLQAVQMVAPDLILLDVNMPDMNGYEVCRHLKESPATRDIPVIFISALNDVFDKVLGFDVGGIDYITKPFQVPEVLARVGNHLNTSKLQKQLRTQNARLRQEIEARSKAEAAIQTLNQELETRVENRTAELQQANNQLHKLQVQLTQALAQEQEVNQLKDEFLKNISHELRTPLNGIIGSLHLVLDELCDSRKEELETLRQADESAMYLLAKINDILEIANLTTGQTKGEIQTVDLQACLSEAIATFTPQLQQKKLQVKRFDGESLINVQADPNQLKQVFGYILDNAIKFTDAGKITITTQIQINADVEDDSKKQTALVTIQDTGIGIDKSIQHKLFQAFVMADGSSTRRYSGSGLGLAISQKLLALMGGTITLVSAGKGQGTTVAIALPVMNLHT